MNANTNVYFGGCFNNVSIYGHVRLRVYDFMFYQFLHKIEILFSRSQLCSTEWSKSRSWDMRHQVKGRLIMRKVIVRTLSFIFRKKKDLYHQIQCSKIWETNWVWIRRLVVLLGSRHFQSRNLQHFPKNIRFWVDNECCGLHPVGISVLC